MQVIKRSGKLEDVSFDKITYRIKNLIKEANIKTIDPIKIAQKVVDRLTDNISTSRLDEIAGEICASLSTVHYEYQILAARITINNFQKNYTRTFFEAMTILYNNINIMGEHSPLISEKTLRISKKYNHEIEKMIDTNRDYLIDYFGFKTLEKNYLLKAGKIIEVEESGESEGENNNEDKIKNKKEYIKYPVENIQHLWMRCAIGVHGSNLDKIKETYDLLSQKFFTHATPTLFHAGTRYNQLSSCFLCGIDDSLEDIFKTITNCAMISKWAGGLGVHINNVRSKGTFIKKTGGISSGILPLLKMFNQTARYVNQSGKRPGAIAVYIEPYHPDIFDFLKAGDPHGGEETTAKDLFLGLMIPDYFMECVVNNADWYLIDTTLCPELSDLYGEKFKERYIQCVKDGIYSKKVKAVDIFRTIIEIQGKHGIPYMCYKDACNQKSNQKNIGTIKSSNLCTEILEYSDKENISVCNLLSISLSSITKPKQYSPNGDIIVYTKPNCPWCGLTKSLLNERNLPFREVLFNPKEENGENITIREIKSIYNYCTNTNLLDVNSFKITFPRIFTKDSNGSFNLIGGYDELWKLLKPKIDYELLHKLAGIATRNLDNVIENNFYPVEESRKTNMSNRPIGIGVQGLADLFCILKLPFTSEKAKRKNVKVFETIYHGALTESLKLAKERGKYPTFDGSPLSQGKFQFDLWDEFPSIIDKEKLSRGENITPFKKKEVSLDIKTKEYKTNHPFVSIWDFEPLRKEIVEHGVRNSLCIALMPTASTSQILGNMECIEPCTNNLYSRDTIAGSFTVINKYLIKDLISMGIWNNELNDKLKYYKGSVQNINAIPGSIREIYKTMWEISQKDLIDMACDRGRFICQTESHNIFVAVPHFNDLKNIHLYAWKKGMKTTYYIRSQPATSAKDFTTESALSKDCTDCCSA